MSELSALVVTHERASVDEIESCFEGDVEQLLRELFSDERVHECMVLQTCNRFEVYVVSPVASKVLLELAKRLNVPLRLVDILSSEECMLHLLRVAAGLESMVVGEDQILGQLKDMYLLAKRAGTTGRVLDTAVSKAIQVGKRVRSETRISKGSVSIGSVAVDLAEEELGTLKGKKVMIIGAGEMGTIVARTLSHKHISKLYVANRTFSRSQRLAEELGGIAVPYEELESYLHAVDVVISATSAPHVILRRDRIERALNGKRELLIIDIANPRDVEESVGHIDGVRLYNIDNLRGISQRNLQLRIGEAVKAERIVNEELAHLYRMYKRQRADHIIKSLYSELEHIKLKEREKVLNRLGAYHTLGDVEREIIDDLLRSLVNKILSEPTKRLREAAERGDAELMEAAARLFGLHPPRQGEGGRGDNF
ncbi:glutamyl-tRNA reductase [Methermicoccus shengliensis]|uniref:Glutamyl-tRNA reductase n=1 Tax=Methermicoccus shengliensis TaxID=660064 RepID=A0A832RS76_9EURY|nr:glutamyl-tRNA reductase [Methermicoccus shengliensis]KUK30284.1 MAG: Glutamyl-tRNA reductase [Methanosarcinales archeaon 56_1174]MDI3488115.1 glutamyl-tRNA reductase [Methanosarcinales archaeon]HIH69205.1 glutamyl-tRNA reductase [Methermicoccus shengliensis]